MIEKVNEMINEAIADGTFPGANYCLVAGGKVYTGCLGYKSLYPEKEPNSPDTLYDMASVTKVVCTTTAIMLLLESGKIRLYDPVVTYVPEFRHRDILIWDLLTHSSGLPADIPRAARLKSREETLEKIWMFEPIYEKNTKIVYSDIGFILLGMVVEAASGMTLDAFAREHIFKPLEMHDTGFKPADKKRCAPTEERRDEVYNGFLRGDVHDEKAYILGGVAGHAGLFSTASDLVNFIEMILNGGNFRGRQFLSAPTVDLLFQPQVEMKNGVSLDTNQRGLGWIIKGDYPSSGDLASPETIMHTGFTGTNIFIDRINNIGFALLTNRVHPTRNNLKIIPFRCKLGNYIISHFYQRRNNGNQAI
ncbi:MAG TPA: beta-lactamase family protein [Acholeplasmataceae bacterium]|jgi:CubicO group peptidase (beta-lactamase class C family)|nr:beta-lactamase family protein [Acholeplasmataceae bacterium]